MNPKKLMLRLYPETAAGGYCRVDTPVTFFTRVRALLRPDMTVLDWGAGAGKWERLPEGLPKDLMKLRGSCERVIGVDPDPLVRDNPWLDEAHVVQPDERLPLEDESVHMVVSWAVFEHVANPEFAAGELARVLKPGGWICAMTPNKWGYAGVGARVIPNRLHSVLLRKVLQRAAIRKAEDIYPTVYKMNTLADIERLFPTSRFEHCSYLFSGPPAYHGGVLPVARAIGLWNRLAPEPARATIHAFVRKR